MLPEPYYQDDFVTIYNADCKIILPLLEPVDLVLTDPPYGIGINKSNRLSVSKGHGGESWDASPLPQWVIEMVREKGAEQIIWGGNYYTLPPAKCVLVWDKQNDGRDFADLEMAWSSIGKVARIFRRRPMNMDGGKVHPTQKPIDLMRWCIGHLPEAKTILDPFMGSGTTLVAAKALGLKAIGIEREEKYCAIAVERLRQESLLGLLN